MELRLVLTVDDFDAAVGLYRDVLGMKELPAFESSGGRIALLDAGRATVEVIEEKVHWDSIEHAVNSFMGWVDHAARSEGMNDIRRQAMVSDAIETLRRDHPGRIDTTGRNHVLFAKT